MRLAKALENGLAASIGRRGQLALCCWQVLVTTALSGCIVTREKPEPWPDTAEQSAYPVGWDARSSQ
ncbi:MAG TPA: hypothetical protein VFQ61_33980, partial [Polyangiaceae bacterium]|nr:hypothetical protein [Polyangiaceae bacterium]